MTTPKQSGLRTVSFNMPAHLRVAAVIHSAMACGLVLGGLLLLGSVPLPDKYWAVGLIMGPALFLALGLFAVAWWEIQAARGGDQDDT